MTIGPGRATRRRVAAAVLALTAAAALAACGSEGGKAAGGAASGGTAGASTGAAGTSCEGTVRGSLVEALLDEGAAPTYRLDKQLDAKQQAGLQLLTCEAEAKKGLGLTVRLAGSETPGGGLQPPGPRPGDQVFSLGFGERSQVTRFGASLTFRCDGTYLKAGSAKALYFTVQAGLAADSAGAGAESPRWTAEGWGRLAVDTAQRAAKGPLGCTSRVAWPAGDPVLTPAAS
ncbi:hypothetical protein ACWEQL_36045 [Kitasatospora sp. NPDC004240]